MTDVPPSDEPEGIDAGDAEPAALPDAELAPTYTTEELLEAANAEPDFGDADFAPPEAGSAEPTVTDSIVTDSSVTDSIVTEPSVTEAATDGAGAAGPPPPPPGPQPSAQPAPPAGTGPPPVRRIYRSRHDRKAGGVSAGIAEYFAIDPTIVRLATLAFMISGVGLLVYFAAWIIVPLRPEGAPYYEPARPAGNEKTMTLAFGLAALALAFGIVTGSWQILALALIGGGIWLLSERTAAPAPFAAAAAGAAGPAAPVTGAPAAAYTTSFTDTTYPPPMYETPAYGPPPAQPTAPYVVAPKERKPQRVTWIVLSLLALLAAVGIAAATGDWWNVSATRFLGIAVIIIGIGVVVGQLRNGGARGLIPLGILAALALFPVSAVDGLIDDGIGENVYRPLSFEQLEDTYQHGIGKLTVDLSELDFDGRSDTIDIDLGIGELIVVVPNDAGGQAVLQAKAGEISHQLPDTDSFLFQDGVNIETGTVRLEGDDGTLDLNISVGLGTAELQSVSGS